MSVQYCSDAAKPTESTTPILLKIPIGSPPVSVSHCRFQLSECGTLLTPSHLVDNEAQGHGKAPKVKEAREEAAKNALKALGLEG